MKQQNYQFLHSAPYLATLAPRNKKSSHPFSEETSSELVWLVRKIQSNWVGKAEQSSVFYFLQKYTKSWLSLRTSSREISVMKITKQYIWGYSPFCSYLITKEFYNWWITRRKWGFRHQISEAKNLKMSVANIWKHSGGFHRRARWLRNFASWKSPFRSQGLISQPKADLSFQLGAIGFQWL